MGVGRQKREYNEKRGKNAKEALKTVPQDGGKVDLCSKNKGPSKLRRSSVYLSKVQKTGLRFTTSFTVA